VGVPRIAYPDLPVVAYVKIPAPVTAETDGSLVLAHRHGAPR
jgi:hypothetical protein